MPNETNPNRRPLLMGLAASSILTVLIILGSRNLEHYDAALFGYTVASVVAFGAVVFRYAIWLQRPATRVYWRRGWKLFRDRKNLLPNAGSAAQTLVGGLAVQRFIFRRGFSRWLMHQLIMWGCIISAMITFPLVFGLWQQRDNGGSWIIIDLTLIFWWRPASRHYTSSGYLKR